MLKINSTNTEKGVKNVQGQLYKHRSDINGAVLVSLSLTLNIFVVFLLLMLNR